MNERIKMLASAAADVSALHEQWQYDCMALGADKGALLALEAAALAYAQTTPRPNSAIVESVRFHAKNELALGHPLPALERALELGREAYLRSLLRPSFFS